MSDDEYRPQVPSDGRSEAQVKIAEKQVKDKAKMEEEIREYEEMRKEEREVMENDITGLKEKIEIRRRERKEEDRVINEKNILVDKERKQVEEERQKVKTDAAAAKKNAREQARLDAEERSRNIGKRSFVITKKTASGAVETLNPNFSDELIQADTSKEEVTKSKEQLEAEKQAILEQRVQSLSIEGFGVDQLREKAKELYQRLVALVGDKYDLENQSKSKNQEMSELAERARQMNRGRKQKVVGDADIDIDDPMSQKFAGAPPKIQLCSKYERHTDRRNYDARKDVFTGPIYAEETARILPSWEESGEANPFEEAEAAAAAERAAAE